MLRARLVLQSKNSGRWKWFNALRSRPAPVANSGRFRLLSAKLRIGARRPGENIIRDGFVCDSRQGRQLQRFSLLPKTAVFPNLDELQPNCFRRAQKTL